MKLIHPNCIAVLRQQKRETMVQRDQEEREQQRHHDSYETRHPRHGSREIFSLPGVGTATMLRSWLLLLLLQNQLNKLELYPVMAELSKQDESKTTAISLTFCLTSFVLASGEGHKLTKSRITSSDTIQRILKSIAASSRGTPVEHVEQLLFREGLALIFYLCLLTTLPSSSTGCIIPFAFHPDLNEVDHLNHCQGPSIGHGSINHRKYVSDPSKCTLFQQYHVSRPMSMHDHEHWP